MFPLKRNKMKTNRNSLIESIFLYFSENLRLFWFVSKQFFLFQLFQYRFQTLKQTEAFCFWFHETNRNTTETDLVSVCFGSNRNFFCLFRGHPSPKLMVNIRVYSPSFLLDNIIDF
jgi:hypothetical protein